VGETVVENSAASSSREVLDRIAAGPLRGQLVGEVARRFGQRSADEVEEAFHEAYSRGLTGCRWRRDREVYGWLRRAMVNLLIDRERRERRELVADTSSGAFLDVADAREEPLRVLGQRQEREDVREIHRSVLKQLGDRQRRVILLHAKGTERKEIARRVAVSENAVKKDLKRVFRVARDQVISRSGHGCADGERLVIRYAFGLGGKGIPTQAQLHLASCERCGQFFRELESWREKVAVLLPVPAVEQASPGTLERTAQKATDVLGQLKQQAVDGGTQLKQHAAATYYRAVDPTPLSGVRPGAAAAAIAGCLAIGSGATYCVENGVDPIGGLAGIVEQQPAEPPEAPPAEGKAEAEQPPDPPQVPATPAPEPVPVQPAPQPQPPPAPPPAIPEPVPAPPPEPPPPPPEQQEFDPAAAAAAEPMPQQPSPSPRQPAAAPDTGVGEFLGGP
jgi:RNA polymerase sigma factor (sigma-70 family)